MRHMPAPLGPTLASMSTTPRTPSRVASALAFVGAQTAALVLLFGPIAGQQWWQGFRGYFANDQMSYAAIATNVAQGNLAFVEPFTLTGTSFYPSAWYQVVGLVAWATGLPVWVLWQVMGALVVMAAVATVGWLGLKLSGRSWAPLLPGLALLTGTLATLTSGDWLSVLGHHAVLWGPFGSLFTLNAEVIGVSLAAIALSLLVRAATGGSKALVIVAAGLIGAIANVQTYSFLASSFLAALVIAIASVLLTRARFLAIVSAVAMVVVLAAGPAIANAIGPLPLFGLLLATLAPAAWPLAKRHWQTTLFGLIAVGVLASPQVIRTLLGVASKDPFLLYRQESSQDLGVPLGPAALAALPLVVVGVACALVVWRRRQPVLAALLIALPVASIVMSTNDRWGFNQEPYRFWLQYEILGALLLMPVAAWAVSNWRPTPQPRRAIAAVIAAIAVVTWAVSAYDTVAWWRFTEAQGVLSTTDTRAVAVQSVLKGREGLVMSSHCLDPRLLKLISKGPVAFYNAGLAWPANELDFKIFQDAGRRAGEDFQALQAADVRWVITDSACPTEWNFGANQRVLQVGEQAYEFDGEQQVITVWMVQRL